MSRRTTGISRNRGEDLDMKYGIINLDPSQEQITMYYTKERLDQIKQEYEINGVVRIPNAFSLAEVNKMRAEAITSLAKVHTSPSELLGRVKYQLKTSADGVQYPALSFWPVLTMPALSRFRCFNRISE